MRFPRRPLVVRLLFTLAVPFGLVAQASAKVDAVIGDAQALEYFGPAH